MGAVQGAVSAHAAASGLKEHKPAPFHERLGRCHRAVPKREINFAEPRRAFQRGWFQKGQGSRMKPLYAQDRSAICSEVPPFAGFYRVSAPVTFPKVPQPTRLIRR